MPLFKVHYEHSNSPLRWVLSLPSLYRRKNGGNKRVITCPRSYSKWPVQDMIPGHSVTNALQILCPQPPLEVHIRGWQVPPIISGATHGTIILSCIALVRKQSSALHMPCAFLVDTLFVLFHKDNHHSSLVFIKYSQVLVQPK